MLRNISRSFTVTRTQVRCIHPTTIVLKKKRQAVPPPPTPDEGLDNDTLFDPLLEEDELFGSGPSSSTASAGASSHVVKSARLLHERTELFGVLYPSTLEILNERGKMRQPPRKSTVVRLTALSETKEDLEKVLEIIAAWRSAAQPPNAKTCDDFIGRCRRLKHPEVALRALQDRPKYGMDLASLTSARRLLHALSLPRPVEDDSSRCLVDCLALAELYPLYNLPPASSDVVSCAILASVIARQVPKDPQITQQEGSEGAAALDSWGEILAEFEKAVTGRGDVAGQMNPKAVQWIRGSIREIRLTMQRSEGRTRSWLKQFRREIRLGSTNTNLPLANASL